MRGPLEGVRIADFSWVWAGAHAMELLAFLGAEVIKIESRRRPDSPRQFTLTAGETYSDLDESPAFNDLNLNKLGVTINLGEPKGVELAKEIIKISDVVAQNMGYGAMQRRGLGYEDLVKIKSDIIYLSSSTSGGTGPRAQDVGFAPIFASLGGLAGITGYSDGPPSLSMGELDILCATTSAFAVMAALIHRNRTGEGQYIDLSFSEAVAVLIGDAILDYTMNGRVQGRSGNIDDIMAPHNCYRCRGEDDWVSIAISTEDEWEKFCKVLENPALITNEKFSDAYNRWKNQGELDKLVEEWTKNFTSREVMERLQRAGVAAMPSFNTKDLYLDPHLKERNVWLKVNHPVLGEQTVVAPPWKLSATPAKITRPAPLIGEHNEYVFGELLGMKEEEIDKLIQEKVIY